MPLRLLCHCHESLLIVLVTKKTILTLTSDEYVTRDLFCCLVFILFRLILLSLSMRQLNIVFNSELVNIVRR